MKTIVMAVVTGMLLTGPALAENVNVGGDPQQRNSKITTIKTMDIGPDGRPFEKTESTNINVIDLPKERKNPATEVKYSGVPNKWYRKAEKAEKAGEGK
jgi:hypothetical protein